MTAAKTESVPFLGRVSLADHSSHVTPLCGFIDQREVCGIASVDQPDTILM
jgi:hypothetical protein